MALSDACSDFLDAVRRCEGDTKSVRRAADDLAKACSQYGGSYPLDYSGELSVLVASLEKFKGDPARLPELEFAARAIMEDLDRPPSAKKVVS